MQEVQEQVIQLQQHNREYEQSVAMTREQYAEMEAQLQHR